MRTRIKVCGVTDTESAQVAVAAGADAVGLVFHQPSTRYLELSQAATISQAMPPFVATVAVLVNPKPDYVHAIIHQVNPHYLQFHGNEPAEFCGAFHKPYIKALRVTPSLDLLALEACYRTAQGILLDTEVGEQYGGSGMTFNWQQANYRGVLPKILAGGLTAENVTQAIQQVAPYGVDVSSGVETNGRKDPQKIQQFCDKVIHFTR